MGLLNPGVTRSIPLLGQGRGTWTAQAQLAYPQCGWSFIRHSPGRLLDASGELVLGTQAGGGGSQI